MGGVSVVNEVEQVGFVQVHYGVRRCMKEVNVVLEEGHALSIQVSADKLDSGRGDRVGKDHGVED